MLKKICLLSLVLTISFSLNLFLPNNTVNANNFANNSLNITPEQFKTKFNNAAKELRINAVIDELPITDGEAHNLFKYKFDDNITWVGSVNKSDNKIRFITIIISVSLEPESNLRYLASYSLLIKIMNPELDATEREKLLQELGIIGNIEELFSLNKHAIRKNNKYDIRYMKKNRTFWLTVQHKEDK